MGRKRQFDIERALDEAAKVFWAKGYDGTTLTDLTDAMGIAPTSLYFAFESKEALFRRVLTHDTSISLDSMLLPASKLKAQQHAAEEVEAFMIAESAEAVRVYKLIKKPEPWYVDWLTALRLDAWNPLGNVPERIGGYLQQASDQRRLQFSNLLVEAIPEARRAPLVLFRLLPTAVHLTTALAFGDSKAAERIRAEQIKILPSIAYCQQCHGELLAAGKECSTCGNPLWTQQWLCEID